MKHSTQQWINFINSLFKKKRLKLNLKLNKSLVFFYNISVYNYCKNKYINYITEIFNI